MEPTSSGQPPAIGSSEIDAISSAQHSGQLAFGGEVPVSAQHGSAFAQPQFSPAAPRQQQTVPVTRFQPISSMRNTADAAPDAPPVLGSSADIAVSIPGMANSASAPPGVGQPVDTPTRLYNNLVSIMQPLIPGFRDTSFAGTPPAAVERSSALPTAATYPQAGPQATAYSSSTSHAPAALATGWHLPQYAAPHPVMQPRPVLDFPQYQCMPMPAAMPPQHMAHMPFSYPWVQQQQQHAAMAYAAANGLLTPPWYLPPNTPYFPPQQQQHMGSLWEQSGGHGGPMQQPMQQPMQTPPQGPVPSSSSSSPRHSEISFQGYEPPAQQARHWEQHRQEHAAQQRRQAVSFSGPSPGEAAAGGRYHSPGPGGTGRTAAAAPSSNADIIAAVAKGSQKLNAAVLAGLCKYEGKGCAASWCHQVRYQLQTLFASKQLPEDCSNMLIAGWLKSYLSMELQNRFSSDMIITCPEGVEQFLQHLQVLCQPNKAQLHLGLDVLRQDSKPAVQHCRDIEKLHQEARVALPTGAEVMYLVTKFHPAVQERLTLALTAYMQQHGYTQDRLTFTMLTEACRMIDAKRSLQPQPPRAGAAMAAAEQEQRYQQWGVTAPGRGRSSGRFDHGRGRGRFGAFHVTWHDEAAAAAARQDYWQQDVGMAAAGDYGFEAVEPDGYSAVHTRGVQVHSCNMSVAAAVVPDEQPAAALAAAASPCSSALAVQLLAEDNSSWASTIPDSPCESAAAAVAAAAACTPASAVTADSSPPATTGTVQEPAAAAPSSSSSNSSCSSGGGNSKAISSPTAAVGQVNWKQQQQALGCGNRQQCAAVCGTKIQQPASKTMLRFGGSAGPSAAPAYSYKASATTNMAMQDIRDRHAITGRPLRPGLMSATRQAAMKAAAANDDPTLPHVRLAASMLRPGSTTAGSSSSSNGGSSSNAGNSTAADSSSGGSGQAVGQSEIEAAPADVTACNGAAKRGKAQRGRESVVPGHEVAEAAAAQKLGTSQPARVTNLISRAPIALTLMDLMQMLCAPQYTALRSGLLALFEVTGTGQQQPGGVQPLAAAFEAVDSAELEGGSWSLAAAAAEGHLVPVSDTAKGYLPSVATAAADVYIPPQSGISTGQACQVVLAAAAAEGSVSTAYKTALQSEDVAKVTLVGMMYISSVVVLGVALRVWHDNGCNFSNIGETMLREKAHYFLRPGSGVRLVRLLRPVQVSLFAGRSKITASYLLLNVPLGIGKGIYRVNLLVVPESNYGITLGNDFNWAYGTVIQSRDANDREAGRHMILPLTAGLMKPGIPLPVRPANAPPSWRPRQFVSVHYEVSTECWPVEKVDSLPPKV